MKFKNNFIYLLFIYFFIMIFNCSCTIFEPASPLASYIHIDSISVQTDYPTQGSNSNKITDVWVLYDNKYLGTFPLPADIPLIGEGLHNLILKAGIIENGISGSRAAYPKYTSFNTTLNLSSTEKTFLSPAVTYGSGNIFAQIEDFDDASLSLVTTSGEYAPLVILPQADSNSFENNSGRVTLDESHTVFEVASATAFTLPLSTPTYLELNYKGDEDFTIGVYIASSTGITKSNLLTVRASSVWKKIYVGLSDLGGVVSDGLNYKIYLHSEKNPLSTTTNLYFDNLKVVF